MSKLDKNTVKKIANLAKLELTEKEVEKFQGQLGSILEYVEKLSEIETDEINYESHVEIKNVMRDDLPEDSLNTNDAIAQTKTKGKYISVPSVI